MCQCAKNRPRVTQGPLRPVSVQSLRANAPVREAPVQAQQSPPSLPLPNPPHPAQEAMSPAGLDAQQRRVAQLRRDAIRRALNK